MINPMEFFEVGKQIGSANSPVSGLRSAVSGVLEQAKKFGLLQQQTNYQTQGAIQLAQRKSELDAAPFANYQFEDPNKPQLKYAPGSPPLLVQDVVQGGRPFKKLVNPRAPTFWEGMGGTGGQQSVPDGTEQNPFVFNSMEEFEQANVQPGAFVTISGQTSRVLE